MAASRDALGNKLSATRASVFSFPSLRLILLLRHSVTHPKETNRNELSATREPLSSKVFEVQLSNLDWYTRNAF